MGEFFAAYVLEKHGVECHHVDREGSDLWCKVRGSIVTIEVKTAGGARSAGGGRASRAPKYNFSTTTRDADWFCFVAIDLELLLLRPTSEVTVKHVSIDPSLFTVESQERSIEEFLRSC